VKTRVLGSYPADVKNIYWILDIIREPDVNIGTLLILE
jgi:hypothetical protein